MCDWVKLLGPMFMSNSRPVKCADILTISGLNLCQEAVKSGKKNNFSRSAVYHISGDRKAWLRPFFRTFTNRFVEEKKNNKVRTITELVTISRNHRDLTKLQWLQTMSVLRKILPAFSTKDHNSCFATPPTFPDIFFPIHLQSNGKSLNCGSSPL